MPAYPRNMIVDRAEIGFYHCIARCVRRAFLCGEDAVTDRNYDHRKGWISERLQELASIFSIDICGHAVMSNHLHLVLRARPDVVQRWSDDEVAWRWKALFPSHDPMPGAPAEPSDCDLNMILSDSARVAELRLRLGSLSWFMRCLCEPIARQANREDECTGRFWEGRFKSQRLLDEAAILACSVYVDLNPVKAGVAETPEQSTYTSIFSRIQSQQLAADQPAATSKPECAVLVTGEPPCDAPALPSQRDDSWLCELTIQEGPSQQVAPEPAVVPEHGPGGAPEVGPVLLPARRSRGNRAARASDQGFLPVELGTYRSLLDWTASQIRTRGQATIPAKFTPILERLGLKSDGWLETVCHFGSWFKQMVGRRDSLTTQAERMGRRWFQGQRAAAVAFL